MEGLIHEARRGRRALGRSTGGKTEQQDRKRHHEERLGRWRALNPATGFQNVISAQDALLTLATSSTFTPFDITVVQCRKCGACAPAARPLGIGKVKHHCREVTAGSSGAEGGITVTREQAEQSQQKKEREVHKRRRGRDSCVPASMSLSSTGAAASLPTLASIVCPRHCQCL